MIQIDKLQRFRFLSSENVGKFEFFTGKDLQGKDVLNKAATI